MALLGYGDKGSEMYLRILLAIDEEVVARHVQPSSVVVLLFYSTSFFKLQYMNFRMNAMTINIKDKLRKQLASFHLRFPLTHSLVVDIPVKTHPL